MYSVTYVEIVPLARIKRLRTIRRAWSHREWRDRSKLAHPASAYFVSRPSASCGLRRRRDLDEPAQDGRGALEAPFRRLEVAEEDQFLARLLVADARVG